MPSVARITVPILLAACAFGMAFSAAGVYAPDPTTGPWIDADGNVHLPPLVVPFSRFASAQAMAWIRKEGLPAPGALGLLCASADGWAAGDSGTLAMPLSGTSTPLEFL